MVDWLTLIFAGIAAVGSLIRLAQNERQYRLMLKQRTAQEDLPAIPIGFNKEDPSGPRSNSYGREGSLTR